MKLKQELSILVFEGVSCIGEQSVLVLQNVCIEFVARPLVWSFHPFLLNQFHSMISSPLTSFLIKIKHIIKYIHILNSSKELFHPFFSILTELLNINLRFKALSNYDLSPLESCFLDSTNKFIIAKECYPNEELTLCCSDKIINFYQVKIKLAASYSTLNYNHFFRF